MGVDKIKVSVRFDQLHKTACKNEENSRLKWRQKYYWLATEYLKVHEELNEISKLTPKTTLSREETRTLKPVPATMSGVVGWVASKKDFRLEIYGSDVMNTIPMPKEDFLNDDF